MNDSRDHKSRIATRIISGHAASDGAGVKLWRAFDPQLHAELDPFLLLDEFYSDQPDDYLAGFPDHPHRGFETVTYMLAGHMQHRDSVGNSGDLGPGSVQWMTAGRGIIHSEMPQQEAGLMRGFQLWVNLPSKQKMSQPRYQDIPAADIPEVELPSGARVKLIAGEIAEQQGPVRDIITQPQYLDIHLPPITRVELALPAGHNAFAYVYEGVVDIGTDENIRTVARRKLALLPLADGSDCVQLVSHDEQARLLLLSGHPINEPIAHWGPFVMTTEEEIQQTLQDFRHGRLIKAHN